MGQAITAQILSNNSEIAKFS
ncbi:MAG: hypothetical protein AAGA80_13160 [Cyanobacteria bacterium P01_F01_bin.143]